MNQKVLLAFAWMTGKEISFFRRFPEFLAGDVTERTNNEKRGLFLLTGKDGNNKTFIACHCYLPNSKMDSFDWLYRIAIPSLASQQVVLGNEVFLTDGEDSLYSPYINQSMINSAWQNSRHYRCSYHLFTQEWSTFVAGRVKKTDIAAIRAERIRIWIKHLIQYVRTQYQFDDSVWKLRHYMDNSRDVIGERAYVEIYRIFFKTMHPIAAKWAKCHRVGRMDLNQHTSSFCERCNRSLKEKHKYLSMLKLDRAANVALKNSEDMNVKIERYCFCSVTYSLFQLMLSFQIEFKIDFLTDFSINYY